MYILTHESSDRRVRNLPLPGFVILIPAPATFPRSFFLTDDEWPIESVSPIFERAIIILFFFFFSLLSTFFNISLSSNLL